MCVQWSPLENGKVTVTPLYIIQDDHYIQVNFAENIRQLKILGSCQVAVLYRVHDYTLYTGLLYTGLTLYVSQN